MNAQRERVLVVLSLVIMALIACLGGWAVSHYPHLWWPAVAKWIWIVLGIVIGVVILLIEMVAAFTIIIYRSGPEYDELRN